MKKRGVLKGGIINIKGTGDRRQVSLMILGSYRHPAPVTFSSHVYIYIGPDLYRDLFFSKNPVPCHLSPVP